MGKDILANATAKVGQYIDFDGMYGAQCADLSTSVVWDVLGVRLFGNAIDTGSAGNLENMKQNSKGYTVEFLPNTPNFIPKAGDIMVETTDGNPWGHVSIVESASLTLVTVIEQNYTGSGTQPSPNGVERRKRNYLQYVKYFVRITNHKDSSSNSTSQDQKGGEPVDILFKQVQGKKEDVNRIFLLSGGTFTHISPNTYNKLRETKRFIEDVLNEAQVNSMTKDFKVNSH